MQEIYAFIICLWSMQVLMPAFYAILVGNFKSPYISAEDENVA